MEKAKVGFNTAYSVVIANMIGVGVFTSLGFQLIDLHSYVSIILLWLFGGFLALNGSFCYSELSAAFPKSGGEYNFLRNAFGDQIGFLSGWTSSIVGFAAPIAAAGHAFSKYFIDMSGYHINSLFISIPLIIIITFIHCISLAHSSVLQRLTSFTKIILLVLFIIIGFISVFYFKSNTIGTRNLILGDYKSEIISPSFWVSLIYVSYAYSGWNASSYIIDDIKNPKKTVPRSILLGVSTVIIIYTLLNSLFLLSSAPNELIGKEDFVFNVANNLFSINGAILVSSLIAFLLISSISALIMVGPRVIHTISIDYPFFSFFIKSNKNGTPYRSIITQALIAILILTTSSFDFIISSMGLILCFFTTLTSIAVIILRFKHPNLNRPIKTPLYPLPPIIYAVFNIWIMYYVATLKPKQAIYCIVFLLFGVIIYYFANKKNKIANLSAILILFFAISCNTKNPKIEKVDNKIDVNISVNDTSNNLSIFELRANKIAGLDTADLNDAKRNVFHSLNNDWNRHYLKTLLPMSEWAKTEIKQHITNDHYSVFYPFSGPDIAFAQTLYNNADNYILVGLEKAASKESLIFSEKNIDQFLSKTPEIFFYTSRLGFFRTKDMSKQFNDAGLADVIIFYLKRVNCKILDVKRGNWNAIKGEIEEVNNNQESDVFMVNFELPNHKKSHIYYFSKDLSDQNLVKDDKFLDWVTNIDTNMYSFNKAASYLMHAGGFTKVRNLLIEKSKFHVQDDTGIPYRFLYNSNKIVTLYGVYNKLIKLFEFNFQKDLKQAYDNEENKKSLPFSLGYNSAHGESNLQTVRNK